MDSTEVCVPGSLTVCIAQEALSGRMERWCVCMVYDMVCVTVAILDRETVGRQTHHIVQGSQTDGMAVGTDESREASGLTAN